MAKIRAAKMGGGGETVAYDKYMGIEHGSGTSALTYSYVDLTKSNSNSTGASGTITDENGVTFGLSQVSGYNFTLTITPPTGKTVDIALLKGSPRAAVSDVQTLSAAKSFTSINRFCVVLYKIGE